MPRSRRLVAALVVVLAIAAPAAARAHMNAAPPKIGWLSPTPLSGSTARIGAGATLSVALAARDVAPAAVVHISASASLPAGATLTAVDGNPATATLQWTPTAEQAGIYHLTIIATDNLALPAKSAPLLLTIVVNPPFIPANRKEVCPQRDPQGFCHMLPESDYSNNVAEVRITLPADRPGKTGWGPGGGSEPPTNAFAIDDEDRPTK